MLSIYRNISVSRETCFFFTNEVQLLDALEPYLLKSIDKKNYLIENNTLSLELNNSFIASEALEITYVYDTATGIGYNVNSVKIICGKAVLSVTRDLWNTYFHKAHKSPILIKRANANMGVGVLDELRKARGLSIERFLKCANFSFSTADDDDSVPVDDVYIVFSVKFNVYEGTNGNATQIRLFAYPVNKLRRDLTAGAEQSPIPDLPLQFSMINPLDLTLSCLAGVYHADCLGVGSGSAQIVNAWITDLVYTDEQNFDEWIEYTEGGVTKRTYNPKALGSVKLTSKFIGGDFELKPLRVNVGKNMTRVLSYDNDFNKSYRFGTAQSGLRVARYSAPKNVCFVTAYASSDKINIVLRDGINETDLTNAFAVTMGNVDGDISKQAEIMSAVKNGLNVVGGVLSTAKALNKGDIIQATTGVTHTASSAISLFERKTEVGNIVAGGDGYNSYYNSYSGDTSHTIAQNLETPLTNPYRVIYNQSIDDEAGRANRTGVAYDKEIALANAFNYSLFSGSETRLFVQGDIEITDVPTEACDYIRSRFLEGVYLKDIR